MHIRHLSLVDFRSWPAVEVPLHPGVNVLVGLNGTGKTNIVEALGFLATLSSHRVASDAPLIRHGAEHAVVRARVISADRELLLEAQINAGRANRARINRAPLPRTRDILGVLRTVLFAPEDLALVRGDPAERRRFMDESLTMLTPRMAGVRADYDRVLKQRNALLKSARVQRSGSADEQLRTLEVWDEHLAAAGAELVHARLELVEQLRPHVSAAYADVAGGGQPADLRYRGTIPGAGDAPALRTAMLEELTRVRNAELDRGVSLVGPHRDELELVLGAGIARGFASHGEAWSFALALRLAAFALLRADGVDPVLILDDVFAELDAARRERLAALVADSEQVLITAAVSEDVPGVLGGRRLLVGAGRIAEPA